ncbi:MAG TPA: mechanosensitive ion channel family protein [Flavipsychrobacter sp.]|nr:mechanosensitive ion channel family protein [Flavipsychrobacter sp.]
MMSVLLQINLQYIEEQLGNERISNILWCVGIVLATLLLKRPLSILLAKLSCSVANKFSDKKHGKMFQELIVKPLELLLQTFLYYVAINQLSIFLNQVIFRRRQGKELIEIRISDVADKIFMLLLILFFVLVVSRIIDFIFRVLLDKALTEDDRDKEQLFPLVKEIVKILLWTIGLFWILGSVFAVNIPALITGLGIGGVAIALAAKESVENFFAAFTILTDKPFQTGDVVKLGNLEGAVERIGFRSTRLRNGDGSLYIIPNKKLVNENLENLTQRDTRKVRVVFNLKYNIAHEKLQQLISDLKTMIQNTLHVTAPVNVLLETFGEASFQLSVNYFLPEPLAEGANADAIKQEINLKAFQTIAQYTTPTPAIPTPTQQEKEDEETPDTEN